MPHRIVVIGCGGIGGWLLTGLAHFLEYRSPGSALILVDGDVFEPKNLERQDFGTYGNKAEVRAEELQSRFPRTMIIPLAAWVVNDDLFANSDTDSTISIADSDENDIGRVGAIQLLEEGDIVFPVVDNFATRRLIFDAARNFENIDVISAGNDEGLFASGYIYRRRDGKDITDHPIIMHEEEYLIPHDRNPGEMSCAERSEVEGGHQLLVANLAAATLALSMTHRYIFEGEDPCPQSEMYLDLGEVTAYAANRAADEESIELASKLLDVKQVATFNNTLQGVST